MDGSIYIYTELQASERVYTCITPSNDELHEPHFSGCPLVTVTSYKQLLAIGEDKNNQVTNQVLLWDKERDLWHDSSHLQTSLFLEMTSLM